MGLRGPTKTTVAVWKKQRRKHGAALLDEQLQDQKYVDTGQLIKAVRSLTGMTQIELAAKVGCSQKQISCLERNKPCSVKILERIADATDSTLYIRFIPNSPEKANP